MSSSLLSVDIFINIPNGQVKGRQEVSARNVTFYAFQQIPYAKPPTGKLRFKVSSYLKNIYFHIRFSSSTPKRIVQISGNSALIINLAIKWQIEIKSNMK
ncbi:hypothetical protein NQ314_011712 [Rhamnusium bicolor]|uniref:Carboxylesterase type B domain-containing protein n=1 Tax=Rhamnusium bicolor TaxID=1586634 RepID=A0AAV8XGY9_9CUCU|nr:hypothetical protein NQ314_011712 [Rhamnusium bicolor]